MKFKIESSSKKTSPLKESQSRTESPLKIESISKKIQSSTKMESPSFLTQSPSKMESVSKIIESPTRSMLKNDQDKNDNMKQDEISNIPLFIDFLSVFGVDEVNKLGSLFSQCKTKSEILQLEKLLCSPLPFTPVSTTSSLFSNPLLDSNISKEEAEDNSDTNTTGKNEI
jgi:hypothetical protein